MNRRNLVWIAGAVLGLAITSQMLLGPIAGPGRGHHLAAYLPQEMPDYKVQEENLGATEFESNAVRETLRFDDYVYRTYARPGFRFSVYAAYWRPGQPARGLTGGHTPDTCWPLAGCILLGRKSEIQVQGVHRALMTAEWRRFRMQNGAITEVVFWHVVGREALHFDSQRPTHWLRDAVREVSAAGAEQYFIRITTDRTLAELERDPAFKTVVAKLGDLALSSPAITE